MTDEEENLNRRILLELVKDDGIVIDEEVAKATPCSCYEYEPEKFVCWSKGVIGTLTDAQEAMYCNPRIVKKDKGIAERIRKFKEAVEAVKGIPYPKRLTEFGKELRKRGIEI